MDMNSVIAYFKDVSLTDLFASVIAYDAPIPDVAVIGIFAALGLGTIVSQRSAMTAMRSRLEAAFSEELVLANRRADHARSDLRQAKREMEHARQRKRGLERVRTTAEKSIPVRPVSVLRQVVNSGAGRS